MIRFILLAKILRDAKRGKYRTAGQKSGTEGPNDLRALSPDGKIQKLACERPPVDLNILHMSDRRARLQFLNPGFEICVGSFGLRFHRSAGDVSDPACQVQ